MILDYLPQADLYAPLHPAFAAAFNYLQNTDLLSMAPGKYELQGEELYVIISEGAGTAPEEAKLEVHRKYIDIQYIINGTDHMGWKCLQECERVAQEYDEERDFALFADSPATWFDVPAGQFTIFFPTDAHAPMSTTAVVRKAVLKIAAGLDTFPPKEV